MNHLLKRSIATAAALLIACALSAQEYTPDIYEFDGSNALYFDPAPELELADGGTFEFWVSPDWTEDPGYDPTIISNAGPEGPSYLIAMLRDRDGLAFVSGEDEDVVTFDFTDGQLHHIALSQLDDGIVVFVDGQIVGTSDVMARDLADGGVWIGSIDGEMFQFEGAIAAMRMWDVVVSRENLVTYALKDIFAGDHPDLEFLSAMSDFGAGKLLLVTDDQETIAADQ